MQVCDIEHLIGCNPYGPIRQMSSHQEPQECLLAFRLPENLQATIPTAAPLGEFIAEFIAPTGRMGDDAEERNAVDVVRARGRLTSALHRQSVKRPSWKLPCNGSTRQTPFREIDRRAGSQDGGIFDFKIRLNQRVQKNLRPPKAPERPGAQASR